MTTVLAFTDGSAVCMGADTLTNVYERHIQGGARKIARLPFSSANGDVLLAMSGRGAMLHCLLDNPAVLGESSAADSAPDLWASAVCRRATSILRDAGLTEEGQIDGTFLLAYNGRLWTLANSLAISHPDGYAAIGSGEGPGIGALHVLNELAAGSPIEARMRGALHVASTYDRNTQAPFDVEVIPAPRADGSGCRDA